MEKLFYQPIQRSWGIKNNVQGNDDERAEIN